MTTINDMLSEVYSGLGGRSDSLAQVASLRGLNAGIQLYNLVNEPPESRTRQNYSTGGGGSFNWVTTLTRPLRVEQVRNSSNSNKPVWFIPYPMWDLTLHLHPTSGSCLFYTLYGTWFYYRPEPTTAETLVLTTLVYPARVVAGDDYPFAAGEDYVISVAHTFAFLVLEEGDSAKLWTQLADVLQVGESTITQVRRLMQEEVKYHDDVRGVLLKSLSALESE